jgi:serine phosphatase RsbU (regulator of sigma subunit)
VSSRRSTAEGLIRQAEDPEVLAELIDRVPVAISLLWGRELRFRLANRRFHELVPVDAIVGRTFAEVFPQLELARRILLPIFDSGEAVELDDFPVVFGDDERAADRHYGATLVPVPDATGGVGGLLAVFVETTEAVQQRQRLEHELSAEQEIAETLEEGLLPPELPALDKLELAARLVPATERLRVGGDFYEVFEADGSLFIVLGDVAGKGPSAAASTGLVRHMLRALSLYEHRPATLLQRLHEAFRSRGAEEWRMCTVVCAVVRPASRGRTVAVACAGHPRPLLVRRRGEAREVGTIAPPLGVHTDHEFREETVRLRRGDRLFFYTDGLTDAQAPGRILSAEELLGALRGREGIELGQLLDNLISWARGSERARDDIALLALQRR